MVRLWAEGLSQLGYSIHVITETPQANDNRSDDRGFRVYRHVSLWHIWRIYRSSDCIIYFNVSLKGLSPALFSFKPCLVSLHGTHLYKDGSYVRFGRLKQFLANAFFKKRITCSNFVGMNFKDHITIHSPYNDEVFHAREQTNRSDDVVFVGRLVSDKGCDILLKALKELVTNQVPNISLTIIGDGPERTNLERQANELSLKNNVHFVGLKSEDEIAEILNKHKILVVPSIWPEPFGIVALEGLACGCRVIVSNTGGLPEAIGAFGLSFQNGNYCDLAEKIIEARKNPSNKKSFEVERHLQSFTIKNSVSRLAKVILNEEL